MAFRDEDDVSGLVIMEDPSELGGSRLADEQGRDADRLLHGLVLTQHGHQSLRVNVVHDGGMVPGSLGVKDLSGEGAVVPLDESDEGSGGAVGRRWGVDGLAGVGWLGFHKVTQKTFAVERRSKMGRQGIKILADAIVVVHCAD